MKFKYRLLEVEEEKLFYPQCNVKILFMWQGWFTIRRHDKGFVIKNKLNNPLSLAKANAIITSFKNWIKTEKYKEISKLKTHDVTNGAYWINKQTMEFEIDDLFEVNENIYRCSAVIHNDEKVYGYIVNNNEATEIEFKFSQITNQYRKI